MTVDDSNAIAAIARPTRSADRGRAVQQQTKAQEADPAGSFASVLAAMRPTSGERAPRPISGPGEPVLLAGWLVELLGQAAPVPAPLKRPLAPAVSAGPRHVGTASAGVAESDPA